MLNFKEQIPMTWEIVNEELSQEKNTEEQLRNVSMHEKESEKIAKDQNTFFQNLTDKGVQKEDVVRASAELENELFDKIKKTNNEEQKHAYQEKLDLLKKSTLVIIKSIDDIDKASTIRGVIDGHDVELSKGVFGGVAQGTIDGEELSKEKATEFYDKYLPIAKTMTEKIEKISAENEAKFQEFKKREEQEKYSNL